MALTARALWGVRSGGDDLNGNYFFDEIPGTSVDYTDQDAAEVTRANCSTPGIGSTTLTDAAAGGLFTTAMPGNGVWISAGVNFVVGMYYIKTWTDANNVVLDRSPTPGGAGAAGACKIGGSRATFTDAFFEGVSVGDTVWIESGTYTLTESSWVGKLGTSADRIKVYGYNAVRGDEPVDNDRPYIVCTAAWQWEFRRHWEIAHVRMLGSNTYVLRLSGLYGRAWNLKVQNDSGVANRLAIQADGTGCIVEDCECISDNGYALVVALTGVARFNECHDSVRGIEVTGASVRLFRNLCYDNGTGIYAAGGAGTDLDCMGNTLDDNTVAGIDINANEPSDFLNNIFSNNLMGLTSTLVRDGNSADSNDFWNNGADVNNIVKGPNTLAVDPGYVNRGLKNFAINPTSALITAGMQLRKGVG